MMLKCLAVLIAAAALVVGGAGSANSAPGQRIDLKVLLLSADGNEATYQAWRTALQREGVPFDAIIATTASPITADTLAVHSSHARYQAVVLATGGLVYFDGTNYVSALSGDEWAALQNFETSFGIRQVSAFVYPTPEYGLNYPFYAGDMGGVVGTLTTDGQSAFPYLVGSVPIDSLAYGYQATPADTTNFKTLLSGPNGSALAGVYTHPNDGREELVVTVDSNPSMLHSQLLRHGLLNWVTKGVYLGDQRNYLEMQVDDIFLPNDRWDTVTNTTPDPSPNPIRMESTDVTRAVNWSKTNNLQLDLAFNGEGAASGDPLTHSLLTPRNRTKFGWINHTYSHLNLDNADLPTITSEIQLNIDWAKRNRVQINEAELVTGDHSGLANPSMPLALTNTGIGWIAADNSRQPDQYRLGSALTVPRYPTNVYYNVATQAEQLDEYNYLYLPPPAGSCVNTETTTCRSEPATWNDYLNSEARTIFGHVMGNDPKPHFFHQSNLAEDGLLYSVMNQVLSRYRSYIRPGLVQLDHSDIGWLLSTQRAWSQAWASGQASGYILNGKVYVEATAPTRLPLTGTEIGSNYGGHRSGWRTVAAGSPVVFNIANPTNTARPTISGTPVVGQTLTATTGTWGGTAPISYAYQWQRCDGAGTNCTNIAGATAQTYVLGSSDAGSTTRVVVMASNWVSGWSSAASLPTAVVT